MNETVNPIEMVNITQKYSIKVQRNLKKIKIDVTW